MEERENSVVVLLLLLLEWKWIDEDFEVSEHFRVVGEEGGFREVDGGVCGGGGW